MSATIIHIVDDDEMMRTALARFLRTQGYEVRMYATAGDFMLAPPETGAGCVLLDLQMPGPSGLDLQQALLRQVHQLPVVFLTGRGDVASSVSAMKAGAVDFLTKPVEPTALLRAIESALERARAARARAQNAQSVQAYLAKLTAREREVLEKVVAGSTNKQIARALGIAERTVKMHRAQVMAKLSAGSVAELVTVVGPFIS